MGMAMSDFEALETVWKHADITRNRKIVLYRACVLQKLLYCLHTAWLPVNALRKLDGFHTRCLRKICGIQHAYLSRVSNARVLEVANLNPLSAMLREKQLKLFGKIARQGDNSLLRQAVFETGTCSIKRLPGTRRRGRPRQTWAAGVAAQAEAAAGQQPSSDLLQNTPSAEKSWKVTVRRYCYES